MKIIGWIRVGDKAACGAAVAEGYAGSRYNGVPFAFKGARMDCAQGCTIAEALDHFRLPNGQGVPHHGHRTSGGCPLHSSVNEKNGYRNSLGAEVPLQFVRNGEGGWAACTHGAPYDIVFEVKEEQTGRPMADVPYRVVLDSGAVFDGRTDAQGRTSAVHSDSPEFATLKVPYYGDDSTAAHACIGPDTCAC